MLPNTYYTFKCYDPGSALIIFKISARILHYKHSNEHYKNIKMSKKKHNANHKHNFVNTWKR